MNSKRHSALFAGLLTCSAIAILGALPSAAFAQTAPAAPAPATDVKKLDETVELSPFVVTTDKDNGWGATNSISGSRVNTANKDLPVPIQVVTSQFINDIGATDLRQSLSYIAGIELNSQNDLENSGNTYGSVYGPGGVNNPQGVTSNANQVQVKIRGFITNNTLRDGFLRGSGSDSVNIERVEVVSGPNALLYGTGNFGGVVDYLTQAPSEKQEGLATFSYGTYDFMRATVNATGAVSLGNHLSYRVDAAVESSKTNIDFQKNSHYFIAPSISWKPTPLTELTVEAEKGESKQKGYGFQALRAAQGNSATPINNDQLEAVSFYFAPGADPRTSNLSGPDTFNNQQASNLEIKLTQVILRETDYVPGVDFFAGWNHSKFDQQSQNLNGQLTGPITAVTDGAAAFSMAQSIPTLGAANGLGGQTVSNGNLLFGVLPSTVVKYQWFTNFNNATRDQERIELNLRKSLFQGKWYQLTEQVLGGWSAIRNELTLGSSVTTNGQYSYHSPNDLSPIMRGTWGASQADPALYVNDRDNINIGWDSAYYLNSYLKMLKLWGVEDRIILMNGMRDDRNDNWSTDTNIGSPGATPTTTVTRSNQVKQRSNQNGIIVKLTEGFSIYALRSMGFQPNFGTLHNAATGRARRRRHGPQRGDLVHQVRPGSRASSPARSANTRSPRPAGWRRRGSRRPRWATRSSIPPSRSSMTSMAASTPTGRAGRCHRAGPGVARQYLAVAAPVQTDPTVIAAWNAAVAAGAITHTSPINGPCRGDPNSALLFDQYEHRRPRAARYMDAAFAATVASGGQWPGWPYQANSAGGSELAGINNATEDAAGFQNGPLSPAYQVIDQAKGVDGHAAADFARATSCCVPRHRLVQLLGLPPVGGPVSELCRLDRPLGLVVLPERRLRPSGHPAGAGLHEPVGSLDPPAGPVPGR